ncbi:YqiA/YcfP family alpha/beta fold hydrolase [Sphaerotilus mobilis]|uniref:YqiA/YcfP family alpha/beta fold hydrolase n=1 Tax=Sphaerotilus mobilis TaxID=47994 RepID=UPI001F5FB19B|nr:YqiA/YcfP family alpha/beta fold hydrolase [Sphaerotilus mobilis]
MADLPVSLTQPGPPTHLLYLHGFRSSPQSTKAQRMARWAVERAPGLTFWCPQLPPSPAEAVALIEAGIASWPAGRSAVMGSSLGGWYATVVAERHGWPAVLLNPAVEPARDLARHIGEQTSWHDPQDRFFFRPEFIDELRALQPPVPLTRPARYHAVIATGDEVLDWREMAARYASGDTVVVEGSDHALSDFEDHLPGVLAFLGFDPAS